MKQADFSRTTHLCETCNRNAEKLRKCQNLRYFREKTDNVVVTCCGYSPAMIDPPFVLGEEIKPQTDNMLKPCPFCGAGVYLERKKINSYRGDYEFDIRCFNCGCHLEYVNNTTIYGSEEEARQNVIKAWNRRSYE